MFSSFVVTPHVPSGYPLKIIGEIPVHSRTFSSTILLFQYSNFWKLQYIPVHFNNDRMSLIERAKRVGKTAGGLGALLAPRHRVATPYFQKTYLKTCYFPEKNMIFRGKTCYIYTNVDNRCTFKDRKIGWFAMPYLLL